MAWKPRAPNVFVLIFSILCLMGALTWIVPGGSFDRVKKETAAGSKEVVVPGSYEQVEADRQTPWDVLKAPMKGFEQSAEVIGFILLVGGAFGVLNETGAIIAFLAWLTRKVGTGRGRFVMIPVLMFTFSLGGSLFGMAEETIVFVMITVPLAVAIGFDVVTGIAIPFIGSQAGFAAAFVNPFTLGIAKGIAEQPLEIGKGYRIFCWFVITSVCAGFVTWHAWRVSRDPSKSPTPELDEQWRRKALAGPAGPAGASPAPAPSAADGGTATAAVPLAPVPAALTRTQIAVVVAFGASMVMLGVGTLNWGWYIVELAGLFLGMSIVCGLAGGLSLDRMANGFLAGAKDLAPAALLVCFSRGILVVAEDGRIIDTLLNGVAGLLGDLGPIWTAEAMYVSHVFINFFVPSGSGQAALTMPLMVPLADLTSVSREAAILTFQFGDGLTNMIIPTNAVLVGIVAVAGLDYTVWFRWMFKRQVLLFFVGALLIAFAPF